MGTFRVVNVQNQGGNVASYFCLADGTVVHAVAGPVDARTFLQEARWAVDVRKLAVTESRGNVARYRATLRRGHLERLQADAGVVLNPNVLPRITAQAPPAPSVALLRTPVAQRLGQQQQVNLLLASSTLPRLEQLYPLVFEQVLGEKTSALPVVTR